MANVDHKISLISGIHDLLPNRTGGAVMQKNLETLGDIQYSEEEIKFALEMQENNGKPKIGIDGKIRPLRETLESPGGGSTDVGDVSFIVPTVGMSAATWVPGTPAHSWQAVAAGGTSIGIKGMMIAAKTLTETAIELFSNTKIIVEATHEFQLKRGENFKYKPLLGNRKPALDYRN